MGRRIMSNAEAPDMVPAFRYPSSDGTGLRPFTFTEMTKYVTKKDFENPGEAVQKYIRSVYLECIKSNMKIKPGEEEKVEELKKRIETESFPVYLVPASVFGDGLVF